MQEENTTESSITTTEEKPSTSIELPIKKYLDPNKDKNDIEKFAEIFTNLNEFSVNDSENDFIFLYGIDIAQIAPVDEQFHKVDLIRKVRRTREFVKKIKDYIERYTISGLVLLGKPKEGTEKSFEFYLKISEDKDRKVTVEISDENTLKISTPLLEGTTEKIVKFTFNKKFSLSEQKSKSLSEKSTDGSAEKTIDKESNQCIVQFENICLGKILKACGYRKDTTTRKVLYYDPEEIQNAKLLNSRRSRDNPGDLLYFPAMKAVCEIYDNGKHYLKILPKRILKTRYTFYDYFQMLKDDLPGESHENILQAFISEVKFKRGIKAYNQEFMKIEDVIYTDPNELIFEDKNKKKMSVKEYYYERWDEDLGEGEMPIAIRYIDYNGKLKGDERIKVYVPCYLLETVGNIFGDKIDVRDLVQKPHEKYREINKLRGLIEKNVNKTNNKEEENEKLDYFGKTFEPVSLNAPILFPPRIIFGNNIAVKANNNGTFDMLEKSPFSKKDSLDNINIYLLGISEEKGAVIWDHLVEASKSLGIKLAEDPNIYPLDIENNEGNEEEYIENYFREVSKDYMKEEKKTEGMNKCIFLFMDAYYKGNKYYKYFKRALNNLDWKVPSQVILYDPKKVEKTNLSMFTNILCQIWAKNGLELYTCDFGFLPRTMVVAYSSMAIDNKVLTSITISIGFKLFEYMFMSEIDDAADPRTSPSLKGLLKKCLIAMGKHIKGKVENIIIYRDAVNDKQMRSVQQNEINDITKAIKESNEKLKSDTFKDTKWCFILVSKLSDIKMFQNGGEYDRENIVNVPVGTCVDRVITSYDKYDFYINSAESRQGTCSPTRYIVLFDNTELTAIKIYKATYYLCYLCYNTTKSIKVPAPLYFVTRRNNFTRDNLRNGETINSKLRLYNVTL